MDPSEQMQDLLLVFNPDPQVLLPPDHGFHWSQAQVTHCAISSCLCSSLTPPPHFPGDPTEPSEQVQALCLDLVTVPQVLPPPDHGVHLSQAQVTQGPLLSDLDCLLSPPPHLCAEPSEPSVQAQTLFLVLVTSPQVLLPPDQMPQCCQVQVTQVRLLYIFVSSLPPPPHLCGEPMEPSEHLQFLLLLLVPDPQV